MLVTQANFEEEVLKSNKITIVDFFATWCGPCQAFTKNLQQIENEQGDKIKICKIDVDESPELATAHGISSLPTVLIFKDGVIINKYVGLISKQKLLELCDV